MAKFLPNTLDSEPADIVMSVDHLGYYWVTQETGTKYFFLRMEV
jgi:hypothetical protein